MRLLCADGTGNHNIETENTKVATERDMMVELWGFILAVLSCQKDS